MNLDRLAADLYARHRKVQTWTRAGCPESEDGGVTGIQVREHGHTWNIHRLGDDVVVVHTKGHTVTRSKVPDDAKRDVVLALISP